MSDRIPQMTDAEIREALYASAPDAPLVERLRKPPSRYSPADLRAEAADEIDRLTARVKELEAALKKITKHTYGLQGIQEDFEEDTLERAEAECEYWSGLCRGYKTIARAALKQEGK